MKKAEVDREWIRGLIAQAYVAGAVDWSDQTQGNADKLLEDANELSERLLHRAEVAIGEA